MSIRSWFFLLFLWVVNAIFTVVQILNGSLFGVMNLVACIAISTAMVLRPVEVDR